MLLINTSLASRTSFNVCKLRQEVVSEGCFKGGLHKIARI